jgi:hypothetical protein
MYDDIFRFFSGFSLELSVQTALFIDDGSLKGDFFGSGESEGHFSPKRLRDQAGKDKGE